MRGGCYLGVNEGYGRGKNSSFSSVHRVTQTYVQISWSKLCTQNVSSLSPLSMHCTCAYVLVIYKSRAPVFWYLSFTVSNKFLAIFFTSNQKNLNLKSNILLIFNLVNISANNAILLNLFIKVRMFLFLFILAPFSGCLYLSGWNVKGHQPDNESEI